MSAIRAKALFRMQYPSLGVGIGLLLFLVAIDWDTPNTLGLAYLIGCCAIAISMFGTEIQLGNTTHLMVQPVARPVIWQERHLLTVVPLFALIALFCVIRFETEARNFDPWPIISSPLFAIAAPLFALATGPYLTLLLRQTKLAFVTMLLVTALCAAAGTIAAMAFAHGDSEATVHAGTISLFLVAAVASVLGARRYLALEDYNPLDRSVDIGLSKTRDRTARRGLSVFPALVRKELSLQWHSFLLIGAALFIGWVFPYESDPYAPLGIITWTLIFCAPVLIGMSAVCEDNRLIGWESSFMLPISRRAACFAKLAMSVVLAYTIIAGLLFIYQKLDVLVVFHRFKLSYGLLAGVALIGTLVGAFCGSLSRNYPHAIANLFPLALLVLGLSEVLRQVRQHGFEAQEHAPYDIVARTAFILYVAWGVCWIGGWTYVNLTRFRPLARCYQLTGITAIVPIAAITAAIPFTIDRSWERFTLPRPLEAPLYIGEDLAPFFNHIMGQQAGITPDGYLWQVHELKSSGSDPANADIPQLSLISTNTNWISSAGGAFGLFSIKEDGTLWSKRSEVFDFEQFDTPSLRARINRLKTLFPVLLTEFGRATNWAKVATRSGHNFIALKNDGSIWQWGANWKKELGHTNVDLFLPEPQRVGDRKDWKDILPTYSGNFALAEDGAVWEWGRLWFWDRTTTERPVVKLSKTPIPSTLFTNLPIDEFLWPGGMNGSILARKGDMILADFLSHRIRHLDFFHQYADTGLYIIPSTYNHNAVSRFPILRTDGRLMNTEWRPFGNGWNPPGIIHSSMTNWVATMPSSVRDGDRYRTHNLAIQRDGSVWSLEEPNIRGKKRILPRRKRPKRIGFILTADQIPGG